MPLCVVFGWLSFAFSGTALAQLAPPNAAGVAMGHLHYRVRDVEPNRQFWVALGGQPVTIGGTAAVKFPDVFVVLERADATEGTEGSVLNHVAFRVPSFAQVEAAGLTVTRLAGFPGVGNTMTPEGERVELFEDAALNLTFTPDDGRHASGSDRHNRPVAPPIAFHHIHLYLPGEAHLEAKAWYARHFGGVPGLRAQYDAVDLPGVNFNFGGGRPVGAPTTGRRLDHIGFEVRDLEPFASKLAAAGVRIESPFRRGDDGIATVTIVDPWGTTIELTEGLRGK